MAGTDKKLVKPELCRQNEINMKKKKKCRRIKTKNDGVVAINVMYANIQGFTGKKTMTMTRKVDLKGFQSILRSRLDKMWL